MIPIQTSYRLALIGTTLIAWGAWITLWFLLPQMPELGINEPYTPRFAMIGLIAATFLTILGFPQIKKMVASHYPNQ